MMVECSLRMSQFVNMLVKVRTLKNRASFVWLLNLDIIFFSICLLHIQAAHVIRGLFICEFAHSHWQKWKKWQFSSQKWPLRNCIAKSLAMFWKFYRTKKNYSETFSPMQGGQQKVPQTLKQKILNLNLLNWSNRIYWIDPIESTELIRSKLDI